MPLLYSLWAWIVIVGLTILFVPVNAVALALSLLIDHDRRFILAVNQAWCRWVGIAQPLWRSEVRGIDKARPGQAYIICANHLSAADIVLCAFLDLPFRWVAKHSLYLVPLFGWQLWAMGHLVIRRGSRSSRRRFLERARRTLDAGMGILMFAEGTRTRTGHMQPFKPGAFIIARDTGYPILPVVIAGTYDAMPPEEILLRNRIHCLFEVLDPVTVPAGATDADIDRIMNGLRDRMVERNAAMEAEARTLVERWNLSLRRR